MDIENLIIVALYVTLRFSLTKLLALWAEMEFSEATPCPPVKKSNIVDSVPKLQEKRSSFTKAVYLANNSLFHRQTSLWLA